MSIKVNSIGLKGLEGYTVQVEVQVKEGIESIVVVGLPDASVKESKERVSAALHSMGYSLVDRKVIINLSPAEQKKNGPLFDLAIALGILKSGDFIQEKIPNEAGFIGALSLDGTVLPVEGMIAAVLAAKKLNLKKLFLPYDPTIPKVDIANMELIYITMIQDVIDHLAGRKPFPFIQPTIVPMEEKIIERNFNQIIGHECAKRALEIAAAGEHYVLMDGPPGCGKSLLAETFSSILPPLSKEAQLEKISLYQLAGTSYQSLSQPPYRHPHHSASAVSLIGGGTNPKPGEVSLAHRGVLFLDELAEFSKKTLDMLRQPLENEKVTISRIHSTVTYPAKFIFIAAMNPCPCGYLGSNTQYCTCSEKQIKSYQNRVSGPILDRIDILLSLKPVNLEGHSFKEMESSKAVMNRVKAARERQYERYGKEVCNGSVLFEQLITHSPLTNIQQQLLQKVCIQEGLSNRVQIKIIRLARTIADLKGEKAISNDCLLEAMKLRKVEHTSLPNQGILTGEEQGSHYLNTIKG
ncbi:YifB family Mg chelatase-like AAA ATPase [Evansella sp. AB-P1]|uniref:YifB family Mg chelatase-like AAA ATPase n=1 Tax=Evansella sp. AB-P1 TaxID=3037653 RepID=UPI00241C1907|nr:YifB family Mg chelatase-like AAA ATPase [Evansella sp. AB-P1]MDG5789319.1 YifB family Mg chelatase-like AAA ATPase [Evansella sp. AB-P1]